MMQVQNVTRSITVRKRVANTIYHLFMLAVGFIMIYPLLWLVGSSFKPNGEIFTTASSIIPQTWTVEHYTIGWRGFGNFNFTTYFLNSLMIALIASAGMVISSALVAFGFARIQFKGRQFWFVLMLITMMLPGQVMMIPRFVLFNKM